MSRTMRYVFLAGLLFFVFAAAGQAGAEGPPAVKWKAFNEARKESEATGKLIFMFSYADWCVYCGKMQVDTFRDAKVADFMNNYFEPVMVNVEKNKKFAAKYRIKGLPTMVFVKSDGSPVKIVPGYVRPVPMLQLLKYIHSGVYEKMTFDDFINKGLADKYDPENAARQTPAAPAASTPAPAASGAAKPAPEKTK